MSICNWTQGDANLCLANTNNIYNLLVRIEILNALVENAMEKRAIKNTDNLDCLGKPPRPRLKSLSS